VKDAAGVSEGLFCRSQPQRTFKRKDVHQYLLQKALAQSHTGETALVIPLEICTGRPNTMYKDESSCGSGERLLPIPQPRSSPQPATQLQTNKQKTKASDTKQSQGIQGRVIYMMQLFFFGKSKP
jgi:hypothetical protein